MILDKINIALKKALTDIGLENEAAYAGFSNRPDLCDFQTNCAFAIAKKEKTSPMAIAQKIAEAFTCPGVSVECVNPGFINLSVSPEQFGEDLIEICKDERCGVKSSDSPRRILIDYGGPNIAKPLHIGHIRSAVIGECLKRLAIFLGHNVLSDIHLGDWGKQMGLVILGLMEKFDLSCYFENTTDDITPPFTIEDFSEIYPTASARAKSDEVFNEKAQDITLKLQNHEKGYYEIWKDICKISIEEIKSDYMLLNVTFDLWYGESTCDEYVNPMIQKFIDEGYAKESEGALIIDVVEETDTSPIPPVILRKSNGSQIYATTDLATIVQREELFKPDEIWYVVDGRQNLHFQQIFRAARKTGIVPETTELVYIPFGTVNGTDGTPYKTRTGGVMKLHDLIDIVTQAAMEKLPIGEKDIEIARKIGNAALKFGDLVNNRNKDYIFDLEKFIQFEGKTGPYILYTIARINSLLKKVNYTPNFETSVCFEDKLFQDIVINIYKLNNSFSQAMNEKLPNIICEACFELANSFNELYAKYKIITETDETLKNTLLILCYAVHKSLTQTMTVLGIEYLEKM